MTIGEHNIDLLSLRCTGCLTDLEYFAERKHRMLPCIPQVRARNELRIKRQAAKLSFEMATARRSAEMRMQIARDLAVMTPEQNSALDSILGRRV
jgi:hypothetical protein